MTGTRNLEKLQSPQHEAASWAKSVRLHSGRILKRWSRTPYSFMGVTIFPLMMLFMVKGLMGGMFELLLGQPLKLINLIIQMSISAMFTAGILGAGTIVQERKEGLMTRLASLPGPRSSSYMGRILAESLRALLAIVVSFTAAFILGARFATFSQALLTLLLLCYAALAAGFFALLCGYITETPQGATAFVPLVMINMFLSTSMMSIEDFSPVLRPLVKISPTTAIIEFSQNLGQGQFSWSYLVIYLAWFTGFIIVSALLVKRKIRKLLS